MKNGLVKKSNEYLAKIEGRWKLNLTQSKIIAYLTSKTHKDDKDFKRYVFAVDRFCEDLGIEKKSIKSLIKATDGIMTKLIKIVEPVEKGEKITTLQMLSETVWNPDDRTFSLQFHPTLKPYFLQFKDNFTKYQLINVLRLSSKYAFRIYELCLMRKDPKKPYCTINITVEKLREYLQIEKNKYKLYTHFKQRVLTPARKQINENTDVFIDIKEKKIGRKVNGLTIYVKPNPKKQEHVPLPYKEKNNMFTSEEYPELNLPRPEFLKLEIEKIQKSIDNKKELLEFWDKELDGKDPLAEMGENQFSQYKWNKHNILQLQQEKENMENELAGL